MYFLDDVAPLLKFGFHRARQLYGLTFHINDNRFYLRHQGLAGFFQCRFMNLRIGCRLFRSSYGLLKR